MPAVSLILHSSVANPATDNPYGQYWSACTSVNVLRDQLGMRPLQLWIYLVLQISILQRTTLTGNTGAHVLPLMFCATS